MHQGVGVKMSPGSRAELEIWLVDDRPTLVGTYPIMRGEFFKVLPVGTYELRLSTGQVQPMSVVKGVMCEPRGALPFSPFHMFFTNVR